MKKRRLSTLKIKQEQFKATQKEQFRKTKLSISFAWTKILTQALFPMGLAVTPTAIAEALDRKRTITALKNDQQTATAATRLANVLISNDPTQSAESLARGIATNKSNDAVEEWLNQFGSAKVQLNLDDKMNLKGSRVDALFALQDTPSYLIFSQLGLKIDETDNDLTVNLGVGARHFFDQQMFGYNLFLDRDLHDEHTRAGVGIEYLRDNLRFSANSYAALSSWKNSPHLAGYDEKAADGFDVRAEGYLPNHPQLGGRLMYEHYFGDKVGLFGKEKLQKKPSAVTVGANYTPIPMVTIGVDRKVGNSGFGNTQFNLAFNYAFGTSLSKQLNSSNVAAKRSVEGSRYDLVDRNNEIVLQYQEQTPLSVSLPAELQGTAGQVLSLPIQTQSKHGIARYEWDDTLLNAAKGKMTGSGDNWQVLIPPYIPGGNNSYPLTLIVYDKAGNQSRAVQTRITVTGYGTEGLHATLSASKDTLPADNQSVITLELTLKDAEQRPISGIAEHIQLISDFQPGSVELASSQTSRINQKNQADTQAHQISDITESTQKPGTYLATLTAGSQPGVITINSSVAGNTLLNTSTKVTLVSATSDAIIANNALQTNNNGNTLADGTASNTVTLPVTDAHGNPLPGHEVTFTVTEPDGSAREVVVTTDAHGVATLPVSSTQAGSVTVSVDVGGKEASLSLDFIADAGTATLDASQMQAGSAGTTLADGSSSNTVTLPITDAHGNPLPGHEVTFTVTEPDGSAREVVVTTDANGIASLPVSSTQTGSVTVSVEVGGKNASVSLDFVADAGTATLDASQMQAGNAGTTLANGTATNTVTLPVTDANGNPLPGHEVTFTVTAPDGSVREVVVTTDANGVASLPVSSTQAGSVTVSTSVGGKDASVSLDFVADASSATMADNALQAGSTGTTVADGSSSNTVTLPITDAHGNPLPGHEVTFTVTEPDGSAREVVITTDANGVASLPVSSTQTGSVTVSVEVGGKNASVSLDFVADAGTATMADNALQAGNAGTTVADGSSSNTVTLPITDAHGNPLPGHEVTFTVTAPDGAAREVVVTTDANGVASLPVSSTQAGSVTVSTSVGGKDASVSLDFVADASSATMADNALQAGSTGTTVADGSSSNTVTLPITDANGNPLPGHEVTFTVTEPDGSVREVVITTDANGVASLPVSSTQTGSVTVSTSVGGKDASVSLDFVADTRTATMADEALQAGNAGTTVADGSASNTVTLPITDVHGNPLPGHAVTFTVTEPDGSAREVVVTTDANGVASLPVSSTQTGSVTVSVEVGGKDASVSLDFVADAGTATMTDDALQAGNAGTTLANGTATNTVTLPVTDAHGNPLPGHEVTFTVTAPDGTAREVVITTDANGVASLPVSSTQAGSVTVSVEVGGKDASVSLDFVADAGTATMTDDALQAGSTGTTVADGSSSNTVTLPITDAHGNPLPGHEVTFTVTEPDGSAREVVVTTDANGVATLPVSSTQAGSVTVSVDVGGKDASVSLDFIADAGTATLADDAMQAGNAGTTLANGTASNTVTLPVTDAHGNPLPNYEVTFTVTAPDGSAREVVITTDANGVASLPVSSTQAGSVTVSTRVGGKDASLSLDFVADTATATIADDALQAGNAGTTLADGTTTNTVTLPITDAHGNPLPGHEVTFTVTEPDGTAREVVVTTDAHGVASLPVSSTQAGSVTVSTSVGGKDASLSLDFVADASSATLDASQMQAGNAGTTLANGSSSNTVTLPITDAHGNPLPNYEVTFTVTAPDGSAREVVVTTDANGVASLPVSSTQAGSVTVSTRVGGKDASVSLDFVADTATATIADDALQAGNAGTTVADGTATNTVTLPITDASGNPLPGHEVTFTVTEPDGTAREVVVTTDASGIATLPVSSTQAGTVKVDANVGGVTSSIELSFVAGEVAAINSSLETGVTRIVANGTDTTLITLTLKDSNNNPVIGQTVTFSSTLGTLSSVTEGDNGVYTATLTAGVAPGITTLHAKVGSNPLDLTTSVTLVPVPVDSEQSTLMPSKASINADDRTGSTLTLTAKDANGNAIKDLDLELLTDLANTEITAVVNNNNGTYTARINGTKAGVANITVLSSGVMLEGLSTAVTITPGAWNAAQSTPVMGVTRQTVDVRQRGDVFLRNYVTLQALPLYDKHGNTISGELIYNLSGARLTSVTSVVSSVLGANGMIMKSDGTATYSPATDAYKTEAEAYANRFISTDVTVTVTGIKDDFKTTTVNKVFKLGAG